MHQSTSDTKIIDDPLTKQSSFAQLFDYGISCNHRRLSKIVSGISTRKKGGKLRFYLPKACKMSYFVMI